MSNIKIEEALEDIFSESSESYSINVNLPSKGKGYLGTKSSIKIRAMTYEDEKYIATYSGNHLLDELLKRCSTDMDLDELYLEDKLFLYYKIREASFGPLFKMDADCISCGFINNLEIDLSQLNVEYADDTFSDPIELELPVLKKKVKVTKMRSHLQDYSLNDSELLDNLWRFVQKIDTYDDPILISQVIKKLSSRDIRTLMSHINKKHFGLDTRAKFVCNKCRKENLANIGLSFDFFTQS
tara:strand:+ start:906 stop:1628 length:723 start_codon:yes stop_codon:yes gene_type:complete